MELKPISCFCASGQLTQTIQNTGNITGNFRSSVGRCCTSALAGNGSDSSCGAASAVASASADVVRAVPPGASFTFVMPIGVLHIVILMVH